MTNEPWQRFPAKASVLGVADHPFNLRSDLAASVEARRELGPSYEKELVESFCDRIEEAVHHRLDPRTTAAQPKPKQSGESQPFIIALVSLGTAIPITAVAANTGGTGTTALSWLGIVGVNAVFALGRRRQR